MKKILSILILSCLASGGAVFATTDQAPAKKLSPEEEKIAKLDEEIFRLLTAMDQFEELHNRPKYMEVLALASQKNLEADGIWEKMQARKNGLFDGMQSGLFDMYYQRFPPGQKVALLAQKYGLKPESLKTLKSDIEIMFMDEFLAKYGRLSQMAQEAEGAGGEPGSAGRDEHVKEQS